MSKQKKSSYKPRSFESKGEKYLDEKGRYKSDISANLYESMLTSKAFRDLKPRQKVLYLYCKAQYYGKRKPSKDYPNDSTVSDNTCFYFNWDIALRNRLYSQSNHSDFYKDIQVLIDKGFIERIKSGKAHKEKTIYKFSNKWQDSG